MTDTRAVKGFIANTWLCLFTAVCTLSLTHKMKLNVDIWFSRWYLALFLCMFNVPTYQWTAVHKDPLLVLFSITPCYESGSHGLRCYKHLLCMNLFVFCDFIYHRKVAIFIFNTADENVIWGAHARSLVHCGRILVISIISVILDLKKTFKVWVLHPESLESICQLILCLYDEYS